MKLRLIDKFSEADNVITFVWDAEEEISWVAGQYLKYTLPQDSPDDRGTFRWFTIAAPPYEKNPRITTRFNNVRSSTFKSKLREMEVGGTIEASKPMGSFILDNVLRPVVLIAGGIGITPYRAMLLQLEHDSIKTEGCLLYANRDDNYVFKNELEEVINKQSNFTINYFTDPKRLEHGDIKEVLVKYSNSVCYISGPEPMVAHYKDQLIELGVNDEDIKTDYFPGYV